MKYILSNHTADISDGSAEGRSKFYTDTSLVLGLPTNPSQLSGSCNTTPSATNESGPLAPVLSAEPMLTAKSTLLKSSLSTATNNKRQNQLQKRSQGISQLDYELERRCREKQLSTVLQALKTIEAKIRNEQTIIRKQLCEKDELINKQLCTIRNLKRKYGDTETDEAVGEVAQYCPKCRKNYYFFESKSLGTQTKCDEEEKNTENSSIQSVEYMSSSEEADSFNSFVGARRSRRYTSKRSFKDYLSNKNRDVSSSERSFNSEIDRHGSDKENQLSESNCCLTVMPNPNDSDYSVFIPKLSTIKTLSPDKNSKRNSIYESAFLNQTDSMNCSLNSNEMSGCELQETVIAGKNFKNEQALNEADCDSNQKYTKDMEVKQNIEPSDDWYASASDVEEAENAFCKLYEQSAGNPVLECVNQILLQSSGDDFLEAEDKEQISHNLAKPPSTPRSKRVHFSTQNTMVQVPSRAPYQIMEHDELGQLHYDIPVHYTNDYEQLGSSNHYVDMESKLGSEDRSDTSLNQSKKNRKPPALPPKPANLIRLQQVSAKPRIVLKQKNSPTQDGSEPDYCSISDVKEAGKTVQIVAEIHKSACDEDYSIVHDDLETQTANDSDQSSEELEESFEDIPKLPMVAEIVPPKKKSINKYIGLDNYITKSPLKYQAIRSSLSNRQKIAQILAEITKGSSMNSTQSDTSNYKNTGEFSDEVIPEESKNNEEESHKSAFDWYNKNSQLNDSSFRGNESTEERIALAKETHEETEQLVHKYVDEKIERPSDPIVQDPIFYNTEEPNDFQNATVKQSNLFKNLVSLAETPAKLDKLKRDKNYQFFLEDSGLSSKPILPRKKRVYYSGPFV